MFKEKIDYGVGILKYNKTSWNLEFKLERSKIHMLIPFSAPKNADETEQYATLISCEVYDDIVATPQILTCLSL